MIFRMYPPISLITAAIFSNICNWQFIMKEVENSNVSDGLSAFGQNFERISGVMRANLFTNTAELIFINFLIKTNPEPGGGAMNLYMVNKLTISKARHYRELCFHQRHPDTLLL